MPHLTRAAWSLCCDITPVLITLRNGMRCAALRGFRETHLTEIPRERVFICQTGQNHDSCGRLLVRIGKVTVVRRPLQSMVCSGRLTICDQKCHRPAGIVYAAMNCAHVLSLSRWKPGATNLSVMVRAIHQQGDAQALAAFCEIAYLIEVFNAALAIKHA
jgi:hypothetical protein